MIVGIVGLGWVGASVAISTLHRGVARHLWLTDVRDGLAAAEAADLAHGAAFYPPCDVRSATVEEMAEHCDAIVLAAGRGAMPGQSRLDAIGVTAALARDIGARLRGARGIVVVVTNPVDVMTAIVVEATGLPAHRVIGTGTMLDTARLRSLLGEQLGVDERSVHAHVLGEHGDSSVVAWSSGVVGGVPLRSLPAWDRAAEAAIETRVRRAAYEIIAAKGATNHAIGLVTAALLQCVLRDERRVLTVSRLHDGAGSLGEIVGADPVALSVPTIVGRDGAGAVIVPVLDAEEQQALRRSADVLRAAAARAAA
jgi:L-lactate dehydrogenase